MTTPTPTEIVVATPSPPVVNGNTANVLALIDQGTQRGLTPEALSQLVALYERVMEKDAKAAFDRAKKDFQAECPVIGKNRAADLGQGKAKYNYADLEHITQMIRPLLEKHGFSHSFSQSHQGEIVSVTCILTHEAGHSEQTTFSGPWATNAGMSAIQKYASATTFCQRYALRLALGLPVGEDDESVLPPNEAPSQRPDAAQVPTRASKGTGTIAGISDEQYQSLRRLHSEKVPGPDDDNAFRAWTFKTVADGQMNWNPCKPGAWSAERFGIVLKALGVPTE